MTTQFEPIAKDVLRLYDYVRFNFKDKYNAPDESWKPGRFGGRKETKERKRGSRRISTYYFLEPAKGPVQGDVPVLQPGRVRSSLWSGESALAQTLTPQLRRIEDE